MKVFNQRGVGILGLTLLLAPSLPGVAAAQADNQKETADEDESAEAGSDISDEDRATMRIGLDGYDFLPFFKGEASETSRAAAGRTLT